MEWGGGEFRVGDSQLQSIAMQMVVSPAKHANYDLTL